MSAPDFAADRRLDPRVRRVLPFVSAPRAANDVTDRDEVLAKANSPAAIRMREATREASERIDRASVAPYEGTRMTTRSFVSEPDGNTVLCNEIRPDHDEPVPAIVYLHGGGMASLSCFYGNYRAWGRLLALRGVSVIFVDFRNCVNPSSSEEVAPFPAGLNDCVAGVRWVADNAADLAVDASRIVVAGDSGGGNLTLATGLAMARDGDIDRIAGLYAFCPYIAGDWDGDRLPSSEENAGYYISPGGNYGRVAYGIDAFLEENPLAWPLFASADDLRDLPATIISVNECDPLRDEGIEFYRRLLEAGVPARCRQIMGTMHATELLPNVCPDISRDAARDLAGFATEG